MSFQLERVDRANTRTNVNAPKRGQNFSVRYRKSKSEKDGSVEGRFYISDKVWNSLNLDQDGLVMFRVGFKNNDPEKKVLLQVVPNDKAVLLKKTDKNQNQGKKKGRNFKSTIMEEALNVIGHINTSDEMIGKNQLLNFAPITVEGATYYEVVKDEAGQANADAEGHSEDAELAEGTTSSEQDEQL